MSVLMLSATFLSVVVINAEWLYTECHCSESRGALKKKTICNFLTYKFAQLY